MASTSGTDQDPPLETKPSAPPPSDDLPPIATLQLDAAIAATPAGITPSTSILNTPLDTNKREIRLLKVKPSFLSTAPIQCSLSIVSLDDEPKYTALSYVWGDPHATEEIIVDGSPVRVTTNLYACLKRYCRFVSAIPLSYFDHDPAAASPAAERLWVDALCIKQADEVEKGHQVLMMGDIFRAATKVLSLLGRDESGELGVAMHAMNTIAGRMDHKDPGGSFMALLNAQPWLTRKDLPQVPFNNVLKSLWSFFGNKYWERVWILQEMVNANTTRHVFFCINGLEKFSAISYPNLFGFFEGARLGFGPDTVKPGHVTADMWTCWKETTHMLQDTSQSIFWLKRFAKGQTKDSIHYGKDEALDLVLDMMHPCKATDPRDKLYALYNVCGLKTLPDYSCSVRQVYLSYATQKLSRSTDLEFLGNSGRTMQGPNECRLPSWVADWQFLSHGASGGTLFARQSSIVNHNLGSLMAGSDQPSFSVLENGILRARGIIFDSLSTKEETSGDSANWKAFLLNYSSPATSKLYSTGIPAVQALLRTVTLDNYYRHVNGSHWSRLSLDSYNGQLSVLCSLFGIDPPKSGGIEVYEAYFSQLCKDLGVQSENPISGALETILPSIKLHDIWQDIHGATDALDTAWNSGVRAFVARTLRGRQIFHTSKGYLGVCLKPISGPESAMCQVDDLIALLPACPFPVILRREESHFIYIGPCFALGIMDGEMAELVEKGGYNLEEIEIH